MRGEVTAFHHVLLAHGRAVQELRASGRDGRIGIVLSLAPHLPGERRQADVEAAHASDGYVNRWFLDPVLRGRYPADMGADTSSCSARSTSSRTAISGRSRRRATSSASTTTPAA